MGVRGESCDQNHAYRVHGRVSGLILYVYIEVLRPFLLYLSLASEEVVNIYNIHDRYFVASLISLIIATLSGSEAFLSRLQVLETEGTPKGLLCRYLEHYS